MPNELDRDKLASILGMLGSTHDGEVVAAGRGAHALIRGAGLTWPEAPAGQSAIGEAALRALWAENVDLRAEIVRLCEPTSDPPPLYRAPRSNAETLDLCDSWRHVLSDWERQFITSIAPRRGLTRKQSGVQHSILDKIKYAARYASAEARL
jgi:hypothetical protein